MVFCDKHLLDKNERFRSNHKRCSVKNLLLKISQYSQENTLCWSLFLIKPQVFRPATLLKRGSNTDVFQWILRNCSEHQILKNTCEWLLLKEIFRTHWNQLFSNVKKQKKTNLTTASVLFSNVLQMLESYFPKYDATWVLQNILNLFF